MPRSGDPGGDFHRAGHLDYRDLLQYRQAIACAAFWCPKNLAQLAGLRLYLCRERGEPVDEVLCGGKQTGGIRLDGEDVIGLGQQCEALVPAA